MTDPDPSCSSNVTKGGKKRAHTSRSAFLRCLVLSAAAHAAAGSAGAASCPGFCFPLARFRLASSRLQCSTRCRCVNTCTRTRHPAWRREFPCCPLCGSPWASRPTQMAFAAFASQGCRVALLGWWCGHHQHSRTPFMCGKTHDKKPTSGAGVTRRGWAATGHKRSPG